MIARSMIVVALALWLAGCVADRQSAVAEHDPMRWGRLDHPLGTYLTIEGMRETGGKTGGSTLRVEMVNGTRLDAPVAVVVDNVALALDQRTVLKGYESGCYIGVPPEVSEATGEVSQAKWQFYRYFIATSIESGGATFR